MRIALRLERDGDGLRAELHNPDQNSYDIPIDSVRLTDSTFTLLSRAIDLNYTATVYGDTLMRGMFRTASGARFPLNFRKGRNWVKRPQEPKPPYPYREQEVIVDNTVDGILLAGTLTLPPEGEIFPAVVLVTGTGPQDRNSSISGHKPFLLLADQLSRNGIAVLRCDDRGVGGSSGDPLSVTAESTMRDALCGVEFLRRHPEIAPEKVGIIGHSEGGMVALMAAARYPELAFAVSMAGISVRGDSLIVRQQGDILRTEGVPAEVIAPYRNMIREITALVRNTDPGLPDSAFSALADSVVAPYFAFLPEEIAAVGAPIALLYHRSPGIRFLLEYDPEEDFPNIECPVLAVFGTTDCQVEAMENGNNLRRMAKKYGKRSVFVKTYRGLNHWLQPSESGRMSDYGRIEITISPPLLETLTRWVRDMSI